jgi:L-ascorbate metabolism protein UlaG (beta-lactamase superfamily)
MGVVLVGCLNRRIVSSAGHETDWGVEVTWHGHSCFTFRDANGKVVVVDPFDESVGYKMLKLYADVLLITHNHFDHNNTQAVLSLSRSPLKIIDSTGTVKAAGFDFQALQADHDDQGGLINGRTLIFVWKMGGLKMADLGDLGQKALTPGQKEALQNVDILFVPVGGVVTLDGPRAYEIVRDIAPRAVFPMHYGRPEAHFYPLNPVEPFLNLFPADQVRRFDGATIRLTKKDLTDKTVIYVPSSFTPTNTLERYPFFQ